MIISTASGALVVGGVSDIVCSMMYDPEIGLSVQNCSTDYRRPTIPFTSFQSLFCVLRKYSLLCDIISSVGRCYLHL